MNAFWIDVLSNLVANGLTLLATTLVTFTLLLSLRVSRRAKLLRFLGLDNPATPPKVTVYLSNVQVQKGGALHADNSKAETFQANTVMAGEFLDIPLLQKLFDEGALVYIPDGIRRRLEKRHRGFARIEVSFEPSPCPFDLSKVASACVILIGGIEFNAATAYFLKKGEVFMVLEREVEHMRSIVKISKGESAGQIILPQDSSSRAEGLRYVKESIDLGIVQKQLVDNGSRTVFFASGTGLNGTRASLRYLVSNWRALQKRFGDREFAICLQCTRRRVNHRGYEQAEAIRTTPGEIRFPT
jgi:hypothetical protein